MHSYSKRPTTLNLECLQPGTKNYDDCKAASTDTWHFIFHNVQDDLPERLVSGHERTYMRHFFDRLCVNPYAIVPGGEVGCPLSTIPKLCATG